VAALRRHRDHISQPSLGTKRCTSVSRYRSKYDLYALWGNRRLVIEFKSRLKNITRDCDDAQKIFNEINCLVCWDVSDDDARALGCAIPKPCQT
jgi:hypothetical protein